MIIERLIGSARERRAVKLTGGDPRTPQFWLKQLFGGGTESAAGEVVDADTSMTLSAYYACLRNISEDVGKLPFKLYQKIKPKGKEERPAHRVYDLIHESPNGSQTPIQFYEMLTHFYLAWGNGVAEIVREPDGRPFALHPIHPTCVTIKHAENFLGRVYEVLRTDGKTVLLSEEDVIDVRGLGTFLRGYSIFELGIQSLGRALAAQKFSATFFKDGSTAAGVFTTEGTLSDEAIKHLQDSWPKGVAKANDPVFLEEGMKWEPLGIPPEQAQMLETMKFTVVDIARWFRMPPHKIQHLDMAGDRANIEQENIMYAVDTLGSHLIRFEQEIKRKLLTSEERAAGFFPEHVILALLRADSRAKGEYIKARFATGSMSPNDIRDAENENPIDGGDTYYFPTNMAPVGTNIGAATTNQAMDAFRPVMRAAFRRLAYKEGKHFQQARAKFVNDSEAYRVDCMTYYNRHADMVREHLGAILEGMAAIADVDMAVDDVVRNYVAECRSFAIAGERIAWDGAAPVRRADALLTSLVNGAYMEN